MTKRSKKFVSVAMREKAEVVLTESISLSKWNV